MKSLLGLTRFLRQIQIRPDRIQDLRKILNLWENLDFLKTPDSLQSRAIKMLDCLESRIPLPRRPASPIRGLLRQPLLIRCLRRVTQIRGCCPIRCCRTRLVRRLPNLHPIPESILNCWRKLDAQNRYLNSWIFSVESVLLSSTERNENFEKLIPT